MTDPSRLVEGEGDFEKSLLRSWGGRQPSDAARLKTLTMLGVGGAVLVGGGAAGGAGAGASIAPKAVAASSALLKWVGVAGGVLATAGAAGYVGHALTASHDTVNAPPADLAAPHARVPVVAPREPSPPQPLDPSPVDPSPPVKAPPSSAAMAPPSVASPAPVVPSPARALTSPVSSLDDEVALIDDARRTLASGDATAALSLVDGYDARFPSGALGQEAAEIRIEALYRTGRRAQADKLASRFLAAHPQSPYARVIRALQAGTGP